MKLVLVGYGKMGRAVEECAHARNIAISKIIRSHKELMEYNFAPDDVAVEFTTPSACIDNLRILAEKKIPTVCGTTGWYDQLDLVKSIFSQGKVGFIYGENFAIGVHLFWKTVKAAAQSFNHFSDYDASLYEAHLKSKKDAPSGTAKKTAEILIENLENKTRCIAFEEGVKNIPEDKQILPVIYSRVESDKIVATHTVKFDSDVDTIEITHSSKGRQGYALGAIGCAEWIQYREGFFTIDDYINTL